MINDNDENHNNDMEGYFFLHFFCWLFFLASGFWLLAFGFWLLAFGFWLLRFLASGLYLLHFGAKISDLRAICCSLEPICMPIWLLALASLDSWLLVFVVFFGFGFTWLLAFGRTSVECMCSIVVCI